MNQDTKQMYLWQKKARRRLFFKDESARMRCIDWIVMLLVTFAYAAAAFINLGAADIPKTFYTMSSKGDEIVVEFEKPEDISTIKYYTSFGAGKLTFFYSLDGEGYTQLQQQKISDELDESGNAFMTQVPAAIEHEATAMYMWRFMPAEFKAKYVTIRVEEPSIQMLEMGFCDSSGNPVAVLSAKNIDPDAPRGNSPANMFDEQQYVPVSTDYMREMYFDEVYHARTAYEQIEHMNPYEITHPPLGKTIIGIGIRLFGMNPFGWRFAGTLFGVLMLPLMYIFAKRILKKTLYAFIPTFLFAVDFMHFTQTRIATIDSYSVFFIMLMYLFMYIYTEQNFNRQSLSKSLVPLAFCGIAFGLGAATKWLCLYAGLGLAVIFFRQMFLRYREYSYVTGLLSDKETRESMDEDKRAFFEDIEQNYISKTLITLLVCVLFFVIIPLIIYYLAYIPYMKAAENPYDFAAILANQEYMYNYHSTLNPDHVHPFASEWYKWPINLRPVFFYQGQGYPGEYLSGISTMGNPAVWWGGLASIIALIVLRIRQGRLGKKTLFLSIAALSQFLPWVIIPRETYIYHYFATVPFLILLMGILAKILIEKTKRGKKAVFIFLGVCLLLFAMFYPVISGTPVLRAYSDTFLRWLPTWPFY